MHIRKLKTIRFAVILCICSFLLSASCKEGVKETVLEDGEVAVVVTTDYAEDGCDFLLKLEIAGEEELYWPIELEDKYKEDGKKLAIKYTASRIKQTYCLRGVPIVIDEIREL